VVARCEDVATLAYASSSLLAKPVNPFESLADISERFLFKMFRKEMRNSILGKKDVNFYGL